jgi:hypothetical protein
LHKKAKRLYSTFLRTVLKVNSVPYMSEYAYSNERRKTIRSEGEEVLLHIALLTGPTSK